MDPRGWGVARIVLIRNLAAFAGYVVAPQPLKRADV